MCVEIYNVQTQHDLTLTAVTVRTHIAHAFHPPPVIDCFILFYQNAFSDKIVRTPAQPAPYAQFIEYWYRRMDKKFEPEYVNGERIMMVFA